jgi:hypothetical protein
MASRGAVLEQIARTTIDSPERLDRRFDALEIPFATRELWAAPIAPSFESC